MVAALRREGANEVVFCMAHRGRLNMLTNVTGKPYEALFAEFEGHHDAADENATGDVKYHMGYNGARTVDGREVKLRLMPNPSHLEVVNPVIEGVVRALQREPGRPGPVSYTPLTLPTNRQGTVSVGSRPITTNTKETSQ